jgi:hypothetical protein
LRDGIPRSRNNDDTIHLKTAAWPFSKARQMPAISVTVDIIRAKAAADQNATHRVTLKSFFDS